MTSWFRQIWLRHTCNDQTIGLVICDNQVRLWDMYIVISFSRLRYARTCLSLHSSVYLNSMCLLNCVFSVMCPYYRSPVYLFLSIMWYCVGIVSGSVFGRGPPASTSLTAAAATLPAMSQGLHTRVSPRHPLLQHLPLLMLITCNKHGCRPTLRYTWPCTPRCLCCHLTWKSSAGRRLLLSWWYFTTYISSWGG